MYIYIYMYVYTHMLEKEMATHSSVLAWRIPGTVEPGGLPSLGSHRVGHDWSDLAAAAVTIYGEGNGTPLQYSCLENSMDRGAWWAAIHGVAKSQTRLHFHFSFSCIGEGNGNPLQCSCLENPRDGGAWWAKSMGSHRVGHDWSNLAAAAAAAYTYVYVCVYIYIYIYICIYIK